jgi:hypothetical protein
MSAAAPARRSINTPVGLRPDELNTWAPKLLAALLQTLPQLKDVSSDQQSQAARSI